MHLKDGADKQILLLLVKIYSVHLHQHKEAHLLQFIQVPLQQLRVAGRIPCHESLSSLSIRFARSYCFGAKPTIPHRYDKKPLRIRSNALRLCGPHC